MTAPKHFLDLDRIDAKTLRHILDLGRGYKRGEIEARPLIGRTLVTIFEKPSTRTRVSFEVGMRQLGGDVVSLQGAECQLGRGETIADTARVLSRYADALMIRTDDPAKLDELSAAASVPVINGLTDMSHPCQIMADVMTIEEHRGPIAGKIIAWSGDGNNVANSLIHAAARFGFTMRLACPAAYRPSAKAIDWARAQGARIELSEDPEAAVAGADAVITDTWVSMGAKDAAPRRAALAPYQVNEALMKHAKPDALFLHCLPAHRGEEVTDAVIDGPHSVVWDEAENRLHVQKGILTWCLAE